MEAIPGAVTAGGSGAVLSVTVNHQKMFAFVEFFTAAQADLSLQFNGIYFNGSILKIGRPRSSGAGNVGNLSFARPVGASGFDLNALTPMLSSTAAAMAAAGGGQVLGSIPALINAQSQQSAAAATAAHSSTITSVVLNNQDSNADDGEDDQPLEDDERFSLRGL